MCVLHKYALIARTTYKDLTLGHSSVEVNVKNCCAQARCTPRLGIGDLVWRDLECAVPTVGGSGRDLTAAVLCHEHTASTAAVLEYCTEEDIEFIFVLISEKMFAWL